MISRRNQANRILIIQLIVILLLMTTMIIVDNLLAGLSALLGGLVCIIPSWFFIRRFFAYSGAQAAKKIVHAFYLGEAIKIITTIALFAMIFNYFTIKPVIFFIAFIVAQMVLWFAPLIIKNVPKNKL